jgi:hypothetical protein
MNLATIVTQLAKSAAWRIDTLIQLVAAEAPIDRCQPTSLIFGGITTGQIFASMDYNNTGRIVDITST